MEYMIQRYKDLIVYEGKSGRNGRKWEWYDRIHEHMHEWPITNFRNVISSFDEPAAPASPAMPASSPAASLASNSSSSTRPSSADECGTSTESDQRSTSGPPAKQVRMSTVSAILTSMAQQEDAANEREESRMKLLQQCHTQITATCSSLVAAINRLVDKL